MAVLLKNTLSTMAQKRQTHPLKDYLRSAGLALVDEIVRNRVLGHPKPRLSNG